MRQCFLLVVLLAYGISVGDVAAAAENWPQFRGPGALGVSDNKDLPEEWTNTKNVLWRRDIPGRGWSSPVVWGSRVFFTTVINPGKSEAPKKGLYFGGNRSKPPKTEHVWKVYCVDLKTGGVLWEQVVEKKVPRTSLHLKNSYASETPCKFSTNLFILVLCHHCHLAKHP